MDNRKIIETARTYLGTPYHHQGRVKGVGVDCLGLIICVAQELNLPVVDKPSYSRYATGLNLFAEFGEQCAPSSRGEGKILVFATRRIANHVGIESSLNGAPSIIHAYGPSEDSPSPRKTPSYVCEHILNDWWARRIVGVFSFPAFLGVKK